MATAEFLQPDISGMQRLGFRLHNGSFIFKWEDYWRKMVLTGNDGSLSHTGRLNLHAEDWKDVSAWKAGGSYAVANFRGYAGGTVIGREACRMTVTQ